MSAPMTRDPLAVTTSDGTAWTRRAVTRGGRGLYAPADVLGCPQFVMATLEELAEHGIQGRGEAAELSECERLRARADEVERKYTVDTAALKKRVAELEQGPALPWAHAMSDSDLSGFLGDLVSAAANRWRSDPDVPDRETLAAVEAACAEWRTPGQGYRSDELDDREPVPYVPTERAEAELLPAVADNASARGACGALRKLLHPLDPGVRS